MPLFLREFLFCNCIYIFSYLNIVYFFSYICIEHFHLIALHMYWSGFLLDLYDIL